jgi:hypothetical protein
LLDHGQNFRNRKKVPQHNDEGDCTENGEELKPNDAVCFFQERQTICASHLARKSGRLTEMEEWGDQIDTGNSVPTAERISRAISNSELRRHFPASYRIGDRMIVNLLNGITQLNGLGLCVPATRNTEAVKNYPRGVGAIECVEVNAGNVVIQKIVTLFQSEVNTDPPDHFRIVLASL